MAVVERTLGRTGARVLPVSLGGEGILRTTGRAREAVPVILEALRLGVRYCDTAPAYQQSQDYYGEAFRAAGAGARDRVFLASKTHERSRDRALRLLDDSLRRLGTDRLDLWQMHDLRELDEVDALCRRDGALQAAAEAKADGRVRFVGLTGHHDPRILLEAMRRFAFDSVLVAINPADARYQPVRTDRGRRGAAPGHRRGRHEGARGRPAAARGQRRRAAALHGVDRRHGDRRLLDRRRGARQPGGLPRDFTPMTDAERSALETRIAPRADGYDYFKG